MSNVRIEKFNRFAVYFVPGKNTALAKFGKEWFDSPHHENLIAAPRRYGFHATLKAPFYLKAECEPDDLFAAVEDLAHSTYPVALGGLKIEKIAEFLALVQSRESNELNKLALRCVRILDAYRAQLKPVEITKRRSAGLNVREERMLLKWGYPYVKKTYRFHMTLTGLLKSKQMKMVRPVLARMAINAIDTPIIVDDICVLGDPGNDQPFRLLERFALSGLP